MKRFCCLLLVFALAVSAIACGKQENFAPAAEEKPAWEGQFAVGFGRADVTPDRDVVMGGYTAAGEAQRISKGILNKLYMTCVAITDATGQTLLLYTFDTKSLIASIAVPLQNAVVKATGVPKENIVFCCTHTHSAPEFDPYYIKVAEDGAVAAAQEALADRAAATMEYAFDEIENMTFVRHYNTDTGIVIGDNFKPEGYGKRTGHTTEADKELRVIRYNREGKKPILMVNWIGHNNLASTGVTEYGLEHRYDVSADYVGFCQDYVEANYDCHFALYMGASGNLNVTSRMKGEPMDTTAEEYGNQLGQRIVATVETMTAGQTGNIGQATSPFQGAKNTFDIYAMGAGSLGVIVAPFEMFDTTAMAVREQSPYDVTFVLTLANGAYGYMPTDACFDYEDCYEVRISQFSRGDAEKIVDIYLDLLDQTKG